MAEHNLGAVPAMNFAVKRARMRQITQLKKAEISQKRETSQKLCW